jgi:hypothetical protein
MHKNELGVLFVSGGRTHSHSDLAWATPQDRGLWLILTITRFGSMCSFPVSHRMSCEHPKKKRRAGCVIAQGVFIFLYAKESPTEEKRSTIQQTG